jgi:hypothetical protein
MSQHRTQATVALGAALALGVSATSAIAATPKLPRVMHVVSKTLLQSGPATPPAPGDRFAFYDSDSGADRGHDYQDCVLTNPRGDVLCTGEFVLKRGHISVLYVVNTGQPELHGAGVITGGTGRYTGASGKVVVSGTPALTPFAFHFSRS